MESLYNFVVFYMSGTKRASGEWYSTFDGIWTHERQRFTFADYNASRRLATSTLYQQAANYCRTTNSRSLRPDLRGKEGRGAPYEPGSSLVLQTADGTLTVNRKSKLRARNILGEEAGGEDVAHFVPHSPSCAAVHIPMVEAAAGVYIDTEFPNQKAEVRRKRKLVLVNGQMKSRKKHIRENNSGLKHNMANMALIENQRTILDSKSDYMPIPLLTLQETLNYDGISSFEVILIARNARTYKRAAQTEYYPSASSAELQVCTDTLTRFLKASAYSLCHLVPQGDIAALSNAEETTMNTSIVTLSAANQVTVPILRDPLPFMTHVAKVTVSLSDARDHYPPDPFLMFCKAASIWSDQFDEKTLPGCLPHDCERCLEEGCSICVCDMDSGGSFEAQPRPHTIAVGIQGDVGNEQLTDED